MLVVSEGGTTSLCVYACACAYVRIYVHIHICNYIHSPRPTSVKLEGGRDGGKGAQVVGLGNKKTHPIFSIKGSM